MRLAGRSSLLLLTILALGACRAQAVGQAPSGAVPAPPSSTPPPSATPDLREADLARYDSQGSVDFSVTPLNLGGPGEALEFDVSMNTHSVDLSWDLASLSTLSTDTGLTVGGLAWPVASGHHVSGVLTFPTAVDGVPLIEGASELTLIIRDAAAAERVFSWWLPHDPPA